MTGKVWDAAADRAKLDTLRRRLGMKLVTYRRAAGISQPELGAACGKTRSTVSKIEHGQRGMPTEQLRCGEQQRRPSYTPCEPAPRHMCTT